MLVKKNNSVHLERCSFNLFCTRVGYLLVVFLMLCSTNSVLANDYATDHILVKLKEGAPPVMGTNSQKLFKNLRSASQIISQLKAKGIAVAAERSVRISQSLEQLSRWQVVALQSGEDPLVMVERFLRNPHVEAATVDPIAEPAAVPNDARYSEQWAMPVVSAEAAWDIETGSDSVVVAVFDTGIDWRHPDMTSSGCGGDPINCAQTNMWVNQAELNGLPGEDDDGNGCFDDVLGCAVANGVTIGSHDPNLNLPRPQTWDDWGHGTMVGGVIGAMGNNSEGVSGLNWNVKLMPMRVIYTSGLANMSDLALGITIAADTDVRIGNVSLQWNSAGEAGVLLEDAINYAAARSDMLLVVAAGNNARDLDGGRVQYPASLNLENMINVSATDQSDNLWDGSNFGVSTVHLSAPGVGILSTTPQSDCHPTRNLCDTTGYAADEGTSLSAPLVAGTAALMLAQNPNLTAQQIKSRLIETVDPIPGLAGTSVSGGRLNAFAALNTGTGTTDTDGDGVVDTADNCTLVPNPDQIDSNQDGYGNVCDTDINNDGITNSLDQVDWSWAYVYSLSGLFDADADFDSDGDIDATDAEFFADYLGLPPGPSGIAP